MSLENMLRQKLGKNVHLGNVTTKHFEVSREARQFEKNIAEQSKHFDITLNLEYVRLYYTLPEDDMPGFDPSDNSLDLEAPSMYDFFDELTEDLTKRSFQINREEESDNDKIRKRLLKEKSFQPYFNQVFDRQTLHELTHKYFSQVMLENETYSEIEAEHDKVRETLKSYLPDSQKLPGFSDDYDRWSESVHDDDELIVALGKRKRDYYHSRLEKEGFNANAFQAHTSLEGLDENIARAHELVIHDTLRDYGPDIMGYVLINTVDLQDREETIKVLAEQIKKDGLRTVILTETDKILREYHGNTS
ncbi:hypothetical protein HOF46_02545 [Candidatus Woesearchaeota archaeon]|jgi:hypothetical protein|nr:hypothetical protein [Candidatus Woesearchaeota archaeon]MBT4114550.1 hypothetical protein [Candidatus Woesearchaeota archaeon]